MGKLRVEIGGGLKLEEGLVLGEVDFGGVEMGESELNLESAGVGREGIDSVGFGNHRMCIYRI